MYEEYLDFPASEARFWENAALSWQNLGGLLVLFVPPGSNRYVEARGLRDMACSLGLLQHDRTVPRLQETYLLDLSGEHLADPIAFCDLVITQSEQDEAITRALRGEQPFYLGICGAVLSGEEDALLWARGLLQHWFGHGPCVRSSLLHICLILSAPLPDSIPPLPETMDVQVFPDSSSEEICAILTAPVHDHWGSQDPLIRRYITFGLVDMANNRRALAEAALSVTVEDFEDDCFDLSGYGWHVRWRPEHEPVREAARQLEAVKLSKQRLHWFLTTPPKQHEDDERRVIRRLWGLGLWVSSSLRSGLFYGLTSHARAALDASSEHCLLPPCLPAASLDLLQRTLQLEQHIKQLLVERALIEPQRVMIHQALHADIPYHGPLRDQILEKARAFTERFTQEAVDTDTNLLSVCSLGLLPHVIQRITPKRYSDYLVDPLKKMADIRNYAAHGGWFTAAEFKQAHEHLDMLEDQFTLFCSA